MTTRDTVLATRFSDVARIRKEAGPYGKLMDFFALFQRSDVYASCVTCLNWDSKGELCKKFKVRPPADIIVNSCVEHYEDEAEIPF